MFPMEAASTAEHLVMSYCPLQRMNSSYGRKRFGLQHPCIWWKEKMAFWGEASDHIKARALLSYTGESKLTYHFRNLRRRQYNENRGRTCESIRYLSTSAIKNDFAKEIMSYNLFLLRF